MAHCREPIIIMYVNYSCSENNMLIKCFETTIIRQIGGFRGGGFRAGVQLNPLSWEF